MVEIAKGFIDISIRYLNWIFFLEIEFNPNQKVYLGVIVIAFLFVVFTLYFILKALGFYKED